MTLPVWPRPPGWGGPRNVYQGPDSVPTARVRISDMRGDHDPIPTRPSAFLVDWEWPTECRLSRIDRAIIEGTHTKGEVPCFGCPHAAACEDRQDTVFEATAVLIDEELRTLVRDGGLYRRCSCGMKMASWEVLPKAWARRWKCRAPIQVRVISEELTSEMREGWCKNIHDQPATGPKLGAGDLHSEESS